jgi:nitrogen fixation protein NifU and related proteins
MDLYSQIFLDHAQNPRNTKPLKKFSFETKETNASCGDKTTVRIFLENKKIAKISHQTDGCMVAIFSASMLSEKLIGKTTNEVSALTPDDLLRILGVELTLSRIKCALLPLLAIQKALKNQ